MVRILVVDDQKVVREGIKILLEKTEEIEIVGDIDNGKEALEKIELLRPDIVVLDINMPEIDGFKVARKIVPQFPQVKIIMLSNYDNEEYVQKATEIGAKGYLLKNASSQELEWSIKLVHQGYFAIKSELLEKQFSLGQKSQAPPAFQENSTPETRQSNLAVSLKSKPNSFEQSVEQNKWDLGRAKKQIWQKYAPCLPKPNRVSSRFHTVRLHNAKKTIKSFEFKLLLFIILFCLGLLVFVALI